MMHEACSYTCGPYQTYYGKAQLDTETGLFHGEVLGIRDVVTFQGKSPDELKSAFRDSVDDYLAFCHERKEEPDKPFSGKFLMRISPDVHKRLSILAEMAGVSLNQFVAESLARIAAQAPSAADSLPFTSSRRITKVAPKRGEGRGNANRSQSGAKSASRPRSAKSK